MSIPVPLGEIERALRDFGPGYLLTTAGVQIKAVTVEPTVAGDVLVVPGLSRGSVANIAENPAVTLLFPPRSPQGYTLLIDGTAVVGDDRIEVTAQHAVLHRPATHAEDPTATGADSCGNDCHPIP